MGLLEDQRRQERNEAEKRAKTSLRKMAAGLAQDYKVGRLVGRLVYVGPTIHTLEK